MTGPAPMSVSSARSVAVDGHYDTVQLCGCLRSRPRNERHRLRGGVVAGFNYQVDSFVLGIEGDWAFGGTGCRQRRSGRTDRLSLQRPRHRCAPAPASPTTTRLLYLTGGLAVVDTEFGGHVGPIGASTIESDSAWVYGWTIGGGMEHAFTDSFTAASNISTSACLITDLRLDRPATRSTAPVIQRHPHGARRPDLQFQLVSSTTSLQRSGALRGPFSFCRHTGPSRSPAPDRSLACPTGGSGRPGQSASAPAPRPMPADRVAGIVGTCR